MIKIFFSYIVVVMVAKPREYTKNQWIVHMKTANFMVYELYLKFLKKSSHKNSEKFWWEGNISKLKHKMLQQLK